MKKLNKNFHNERKTIEAMLNLCANGTCVCDYPDTCNCELFGKNNYDAYKDLMSSTKSAVFTNLKTN